MKALGLALALGALAGCSSPTGGYLSALSSHAQALSTANKAALADLEAMELVDQQAALQIAKDSKDRAAITCAGQGVAVATTPAVGPASVALKLDEYAQMAAKDCQPLNQAALSNFLGLASFFAGLGL